MKTKFQFTAWCGYNGTRIETVTMSTLKECIRAIRSPKFAHGRCRRWCGQEIGYIYHRDPASPSGKFLVAASEHSVVSHLLERYRRPSCLSPTEMLGAL